MIIESAYRAEGVWRNPHLNTIWASKVRSVDAPARERRRLDTPDGDFLDVDCLMQGSRKAAILLHGLEGSADRTYRRGMTHALAADGWDVVAMNLRGCSGEPNRLPRSYHSGATEDLRAVLDALGNGYDTMAAVGFSLGGNLLLKYLGEEGSQSRIDAAVAVSVPCDLAGSSNQLALRGNRLYMWNFMRSLRRKVQEKAERFPDIVSTEGLNDMRTFHEFDDHYTAPLHGFRDAEHYWAACSSRSFLPEIRVPTLLLNAVDDPFLSEGCYPVDACHRSQHVTLEMPDTGGHVGFLSGDQTYTETRGAAFLQSII